MVTVIEVSRSLSHKREKAEAEEKAENSEVLNYS